MSFVPKHKSTPAPVRIAAFDFDGTITTKDTFALFLRYWAGTPKWLAKLFVLLPVFCLYGLRIIDRHKVKAHVVRVFFKGADAQEFQQRATQFATEIIPQLIRPKALQELKIKRESGLKVVLVSASINHYLDIWAKNNKIEKVIATNLEVEDGRLTGAILGPNCWGAGKMTKIRSEMAESPFILAEAYGDSRGDAEMLHAAQASFFKPFRL